MAPLWPHQLISLQDKKGPKITNKVYFDIGTRCLFLPFHAFLRGLKFMPFLYWSNAEIDGKLEGRVVFGYVPLSSSTAT